MEINTYILEMANSSDGTWHDMCPYSTAARHEHVLLEHAARHDTHVGWAELRILGARALKIRHD